MEYSILKLQLSWSGDRYSRVPKLNELAQTLKFAFGVDGAPERLLQPDSYERFADLYFNLKSDSKTVKFRYTLSYWGNDTFKAAIEFHGCSDAEIKEFLLHNGDKFTLAEGYKIIPYDRNYYNVYQWLRTEPPIWEKNSWNDGQKAAVEKYCLPLNLGGKEYWLLEGATDCDPASDLAWITKVKIPANLVSTYNVYALQDGNGVPATLFKDTFRERLAIQVGEDYEEQVFINNWFFTLRVLDEKLNQQGRAIICNGTSKNAIAAGFCLDMGDGSFCYRYIDRQQAPEIREARVTVDTLLHEPWNYYVTEEEQLAGRFHKRFEANQDLKNSLRQVSTDAINIW